MEEGDKIDTKRRRRQKREKNRERKINERRETMTKTIILNQKVVIA